MIIRNLIAALGIFLVSLSSWAGFSSYDSYNTSGSVVAPIQIKDDGVYNLVVSVEFLRKPYDRGEYDSEEYSELITSLNVKWQGLVIQKILESPEIEISGLAALKKDIEAAINDLVKKAKPKHRITATTEVIYSVDNFYILDVSGD